MSTDRQPLTGLELPPGWRLDARATTGSTNADAAEAVRAGAAPGLVVVADSQTAGRGRLDRQWTSPPGAGLTCSLVLPAAVVPELPGLGWLPLTVGIALEGALVGLGVASGLKWPNDVLVGDRKIAGVLAEVVDGTVVVGVGVNVSSTADELLPTATSIAIEGGRADRGELLVQLLEELDVWLRHLRDTPGMVRSAYHDHCVTLGRQVAVDMPGGRRVTGTALDVDDAGRLVVETGTGTEAVAAGDVVHATAA